MSNAWLGHRRGGLEVVPHDVADGEHRGAVGLQERVVPVAADPGRLGGRQVPDDDLGVVGLRWLGEQAALQRLGHLLLLAEQPGVVQREPGPVGDVLALAVLVDRDRRVVAVAVVVELGREEDLVALQAGLGQRPADALLVAVHLRGVDVPVAGVEGRAHRLRRLMRRHLEHPETELRDLHAVVQSDRRNLSHAGGLPG